MATTTTIYATKGTRLNGDDVTGNDSSAATWVVGQNQDGLGDGERSNLVFSFDVSAYTKPSDIVKVMLNLKRTIVGNSGTSVREIYAYRLDQDFTEDEATWNEADDGVDWTGGTTVGAANNSAITQYTKSARKKLVGKCEVGFRVTTEPDIDITELVKDAINRRSGTLLLWVGIPLSDSVTTRGMVAVHSNNAVTESNRPKIDITVAERVLWNGSVGDGNMDTVANWSTGSEPTSEDFALFNTGSVSVDRGSIDCDKCFVGRGYGGTIEDTGGTSIGFNCNEMILNSRKAKWHLEINEVASGDGCAIWVGDTNGTPGSSKFEGGSGTSGTYTVIVRKARSTLEINSTTIDCVVDVHGGAKVALANRYTVRATKSLLTFNSGLITAVFADNTSAYITKTSAVKGDITVVGQSVITIYAEEIEDLTIYSGRVGFRGNDGSPIVVGTTKVYNNGVLDTRTSATNFSLDGSEKITSYGGKVLFDPSTKVAIA